MEGSEMDLEFQLLSDVHLEINVDDAFNMGHIRTTAVNEEQMAELRKRMQDPARHPQFERAAPNLCLLGDIGYPSTFVYREFVASCAQRYDNVFILAGNHEYYSSKHWYTDVDEVEEDLKKLEAEFSNVHFLQRSCHVMKSGDATVRLIGTTLWSPPHPGMNDLSQVYCAGEEGAQAPDGIIAKRNARTSALVERLHPDRMADWHARDLFWVMEQMADAEAAGEVAVVLTHHPPPPTWEGRCVAWLHGHTHCSNARIVGDTLVCSNQVGYLQMGEKDHRFAAELVVGIPSSPGKEAHVVRKTSVVKEAAAAAAQLIAAAGPPAASPPPPPPPPV